MYTCLLVYLCTFFMNCSIVIRAYNEEKHIGRLLEGIREQTVKDVEIILVDSGSTDRTAAVAESCGAQVLYIPSAFHVLVCFPGCASGPCCHCGKIIHAKWHETQRSVD